jgi:hypothetical protein
MLFKSDSPVRGPPVYGLIFGKDTVPKLVQKIKNESSSFGRNYIVLFSAKFSDILCWVDHRS